MAYARLEDIPVWDVAEHLKTPEDIAFYVEAALEEDDSTLLARAIGNVARASRLPTSEGGDVRDQLGTLMGALRAIGLRLSVQPISAGAQGTTP